MPTDPKVSGQAGETEGLPTPIFSEQKATSSTSPDADEIVSKILAQLDPLIEKKVQGTKDKRFNRIEKALGGRLDLLAELEGEGVSIDPAVRTQMQIRDLQDRLTQSPNPNDQPAPGTNDGSLDQRTAVTEAIAELTKYDLNSNDPNFIALLRGQYRDRSAFDLAVNRYILEKKVAPTQQPPSPATVVQSAVTSGAVGKRTAADATTAYTKERDQIAQTMRGDAKIKALTELKTKYRESDGLDLH